MEDWIKEKDGEVKFKYDVFELFYTCFLNAAMYHHPVQQ
jgi:hypothetical protein